jgi:pterin-4a-carbinolamine dehydratase
MSTSQPKSVFISYRRRDASPIARWLSETIEQNFGEGSVFIDTDAIEIGDEWPQRIEVALKKASALIVLIGPDWLRSHDESGRRRLDDVKDWVRKEIIYALQNGGIVLPVLVSNAELPGLEALPKPLRGLLNHQAFELRVEQWKTDIKQLLDRLESIGFLRAAPQIQYPKPGKNPRVLSEEELLGFLEHHPQWRLVARIGPKGEKRTELMGIFEFASFEDAMHFMIAATRHIVKVDHHPDWENIWRTITIWLTTWDIGHKPSHYDVELAQYLDELFGNYVTN